MRYRLLASVEFGGDTPTAVFDDVLVEYSVTWGAPERGPSYASGGQPADPDEISDARIVSIDGTPWANYARDYTPIMAAHTADAILDAIVDTQFDAMIEAAQEAHAEAESFRRERAREYA